jgi:hypothetical protein
MEGVDTTRASASFNGNGHPDQRSMIQDQLLKRSAAALILLCAIAIAASLLYIAFGPEDGLSAPPWAGLDIGDRIGMSDTNYKDRPFTSLIFVRSSCGACQNSVPFLQAFIAAGSARNIPSTVVVLADDSGASRYVERIGSGRTRVVILSRAEYMELPVKRIPTVVIVNQEGRVVLQMTGTPTADAQNALIASIASLR